MFTGIVQSVGHVQRIEARGGDLRLHVDSGALDVAGLHEGDSVAVAGCCLTALAPHRGGFAADVSRETLSLTTLGALTEGSAVNLELALRMGDRLGGHLVSGHVDGVARVLEVRPDARSQRWWFEVPEAFARYIAVKGSVCLDGVSLTVNGVDGVRFDVNLIPHTIEHTTFRARRAGDSVNLEVDLVARYLERLVAV